MQLLKNQQTKAAFLALGLTILPFFSAYAAREDVIQKSFKVESGGKLTMKVDRGAIKIKTADTDTASIEVTRKVTKGSDEVLSQHKVEISQSGNDILIESEMPKSMKKGWRLFRGLDKFQVTYSILLPKKFEVNARTSGGEIKINELIGNVQARTAGGDITLGTINGTVSAQTSGGSVHLDKGGADADLGTSGGDIQVGSVSGALVAKTSGGSIMVEHVEGKTVAETSGGDIRLADVAGLVKANTSGGSITAGIHNAPKGDCVLQTSGGDITLSLSGSAAVSVDARTSGGEVRTEFPESERKNRSRLNANINGGGAKISMQTSGGDVKIKKI